MMNMKQKARIINYVITDMCSVPLSPDMLISSRAVGVSNGSAKLSTAQFMCNVAFNERSVIPVARPDYQLPSQQNCTYSVHWACFCTLARLAKQVSLPAHRLLVFISTVRLPFPFSYLLSPVSVCVCLETNVGVELSNFLKCLRPLCNYQYIYRVTINNSFVFKTLFLLCRHFLKALNSCCQLVHTLQTWWVYGSFHISTVFVRVILWTI
jgi:hypothetical protein